MDMRNERAQRGLTMIAAAEENIRKVARGRYQVRSQSGNGWYDVRGAGTTWTCSCPDYKNGNLCKHTWAVEFSLRLRKAIQKDDPVPKAPNTPTPNVPTCPKCQSTNVIRKATRQCKGGIVQRYKCKACGRRFVPMTILSRVHVATPLVVAAFDLWAKKVSYRQIAHHLFDVHGVKLGKSTVERWVRAMATMVGRYSDTVIAESRKVGKMWHADETTVNIDGKLEWTWNVMDHETRLWLASRISEGKDTKDARGVLRKAVSVAGKKPGVFITDGQRAYQDAVNKEWYDSSNPTRHMVLLPMRTHPKTTGEKGMPPGIHPGNNIMERLQGTQRERTKVLRGFDHQESAQTLVDGLRGYYNLARPHAGLGGLTPAQSAGIIEPTTDNGVLENILMTARRKNGVHGII